jgi:hypothetical protein
MVVWRFDEVVAFRFAALACFFRLQPSLPIYQLLPALKWLRSSRLTKPVEALTRLTGR